MQSISNPIKAVAVGLDMIGSLQKTVRLYFIRSSFCLMEVMFFLTKHFFVLNISTMNKRHFSNTNKTSNYHIKSLFTTLILLIIQY